AMTPPKFVVYLTCLLLETIVATQKLSSHRQEARFISADVGGSLTLRCFYKHTDATRFYWYKQSLGQKPSFICTVYMLNTVGTCNDEFQNNSRFTMTNEAGNNHFHIKDLRISDSGTYYFNLEFAEGIVVSVKGSGLNFQALVQKSASETSQPGDPATLSCTVHTGICDGEHSVYWFRTEEESLPRIIYTQGGTNDQCGKKPNTQTQTCVHNLPIKNLSHAGTYYCAVASCGHIVFGNGTKLDTDDEGKSLFLVYFLSGALTFTAALVVLLAFLLFKMSKKSRFQSESPDRFSAPSTEVNQDADNLHYASISVKPPNRPKRQRNTESQCVYSTVKQ
uniref:Ig-like domain-containing protein n=1 Tax=Stegastes partitus TaxID=144197 RepID=A0A3B5A013_9TELE